MNPLTVVLALFALVGVAIAVYVFTVAARKNVSEQAVRNDKAGHHTPFSERTSDDRRQFDSTVVFPAQIGDDWVEEDRRQSPERRLRMF